MTLENELRRLLRAKAAAFSPAPQPHASVVRRARVRMLRRMAGATLVLAGAALVGTTLTSRITPSQRAFAALAVQKRAQVQSARPRGQAGSPSERHAAPGEPV